MLAHNSSFVRDIFDKVTLCVRARKTLHLSLAPRPPRDRDCPSACDRDSNTRDNTTAIKMSSTTLFDLPAELRNRIYALAVKPDDPSATVKLTLNYPHYKEPPLLSVSRQIRQEAMGVFIGETIFEEESSYIIRFLKTLSDEKMKWLRTIRVLVYGSRECMRNWRWMEGVLKTLDQTYPHGRGLLRGDAIQFPIVVEDGYHGEFTWVHLQNIDDFEASGEGYWARIKRKAPSKGSLLV